LVPPDLSVATGGGKEWPLISLFAVFDGHGGAEASAYCKAHLHSHLAEKVMAALEVSESASLATADLARALHEAFIATDEGFISTTGGTAGTTAVVALLAGDHLLVANAGDSRAVLWRDGRSVPMSVDHKPDRPDETARISAAGGFVAHGRVMHALAVSRAIGDREFKRCDFEGELPFSDSLVIPDPEIRVCRIAEGDELLIACDGLWDVMEAADAFGFLQREEDSSPQRAVSQLTRMAEVDLKSSDNITAIYAKL
jgi:serine/threonine protein phosphatase PrpC